MQNLFKFLLSIFLIINSLDCSIFNAGFAGSWYPSEKKELISLFKESSRAAKKDFAMQTDGSKIRAIIVPHAGYVFSAKTATAIYNLINNNKYDRIIILGPSHFVKYNGIGLPEFNQYKTPLGISIVDNLALKSLGESRLITFNTNIFKTEHSVEMQLPMIQYFLKNSKIIPILVGQLTENELIKITNYLKSLITKNSLIIVSSDFTHYGKKYGYLPFKNNILNNIKQLD